MDGPANVSQQECRTWIIIQIFIPESESWKLGLTESYSNGIGNIAGYQVTGDANVVDKVCKRQLKSKRVRNDQVILQNN